MKFKFCIALLFLVACSSTDHQQLYDKKPAFYAYVIGDVQEEVPSVEHAADVFITPASCQKTITALLAYKTLGSEFCYETKLAIAKRHGKNPDLIINFAGDPTLSSEDLLKLLSSMPFKNSSAQTSFGKIIVDTSLFKTPAFSRNIIIDDMGTSYGRPVTAASIDQNLIHLSVTPNTFGKLATLENDAGYQTEVEVLSSFEKTAVKISWNGCRIRATGNIHVADKPLKLTISPEDIDGYILNKLSKILKLANISGNLVTLKDPSKLQSHAKVAAIHKSKPLGAIIPGALKLSDNHVFDSLYLKVIHLDNPQTTKEWQDGDKVFKLLIKRHFNLAMDKALFVDGSGLSRYNRIQPRQLFKLLQKSYSVKEFADALPFPGEACSTIVNRKSLPVNLKAKTGSMSGISCLCGFYKTDNASPQAFVIAAHSFAPPISDTNDVLDEFLKGYFVE